MHNKAFLSFLNELAAIPVEIREAYMNNLSRKVNTESNKIIHLLKISNRAIEHNKTETLSERYVCKSLGITSSLLTCYRSRLIKRIREYYFGKLSEKYPEKNSPSLVNTNSMDSISQLFHSGRIREAKNLLLKNEKKFVEQLSSLNKSSKAEIINGIISDICNLYEMLCTYYFQTHNFKYFTKYLKKFLVLENRINYFNKHLNKTTAAVYQIQKNLILSRKYLCKIINDKQILNALRKLLAAHQQAKKINETNYIYKTAFDIGKAFMVLNKDKEAEKYYKLAYSLAFKKNHSDYILLFQILLNELDFRKDITLCNSHLEYIENNYEKIFNGNLYFLHILKAQLIYMQLLIHSNDLNKFNKIAQELFKRLYLYSMKAEADIRIYLDKADEYSKNIFSISPVFDDESNLYRLELTVHTEWIKKLEKLNTAYQHSIKNIESISTLCIIYLTILETEFWKGKKCDFENAYYFIEKLQRLIRTRNLSIYKIWFETNHICIKMMDDLLTGNKSLIYRKYYKLYLKKYYDNFKSPKQKANLINEFAKLKFVANTFGLSELENDLIDLEKWINEYRPELIENLPGYILKRN